MSGITIDHDHLRDALADGLRRLSGRSWTRADDGSIRSEGTPVVFIADLHRDENPGPGHVDIGFAVNPERPTAPVLWDCATGMGNTPGEVAEYASYIWLQTTAPAVLEVLEQRSRLADHHDPGDPGGLPGMHVVQGPALVFGTGDTTPLQEWVADNFVLPALGGSLLPQLTGDVHGIKLLFGGTAGKEVAEVRLDHVYDEASSLTLANLLWPRLPFPAFARAYLLVMPLAD